MPFKKGNKLSTGRPKGAKSKVSESFWLDWLEVYNKLGNVKVLEEFALSSKRNMEIFLAWGAKTIPTNVQESHSGKVDHVLKFDFGENGNGHSGEGE
jgi:hypothetical protein